MFEVIENVKFPKPTDININMMPFILGDSHTIPTYLLQYLPIINACKAKYIGHTCYLTISESYIKKGDAQRRGGIHTEATSKGPWGGNWGESVWMASTVNDSCRVWNEEIPHSDLGEGGCCKHLNISSEHYDIQSGELVNMSDCTPHQAMPQSIDSYRKFFRLVGPDIYGWFEQHSTKNPLCRLPESVPVITRNKFA